MYGSVDENQILASFGLNATDEINEMLMGYIEETRMQPGQRTLGNSITIIRREYGAMVEIGRMGKLQEIPNCKRKPEMSIRSFWPNSFV